MNSNQFDKRQKEHILEQWLALISAGYINGKDYLTGHANKFANPVSFTFNSSLPLILDALLVGKPEIADDALKQIMQIRAVQFGKPSESISFLEDLRSVMFDYTDNHTHFAFDKVEFDNAFLQMLNHANDLFFEFKAKTIEIKYSESSRTFGRMIERLNNKYSDYKDN